jgi:antitoxin HicB
MSEMKMSEMKREETINTLWAQYAFTFRPEKGDGFTVRCAAFPELITNGSTLEEARHNAREALELCLEVYKDEGRPIPPSDGDPERTLILATPHVKRRGRSAARREKSYGQLSLPATRKT